MRLILIILLQGLWCVAGAQALAIGNVLKMFKPGRGSRHEIIDSTSDNKPIDDIGPIAEVLCRWSTNGQRDNNNKSADGKKQISRQSTVDKLANFFESSAVSGGYYAQCAERYRDIVADLNLVLKTRPDNVCSEEKVSAIERFHNKHLSTSSNVAVDLVKARAEADRHPMLNLFFMYYVMEVSAICKNSVLEQLQLAHGEFEFTEDEYELVGENNSLAHLLSGISGYLAPPDKLSDLDDIVYLWDLLGHGIVGKIIRSTLLVADDDEQQQQQQQPTQDDQIDPETGAPIRILLKVKDGQTAKLIQSKCLNRFRPIYSKIIVPVTRLSNLGYFGDFSNNQNSKEKSALLNNELLKKWYNLVQVCEALRPIKFYEDPSLDANDAVIMTMKEAQQLDGETQIETQADDDDVRIEYEPSTNKWPSGMDRLVTVDELKAQDLVRRIKLNLSAHDRSMNRIFARLVKNSYDSLKSKISQGMGKIFVFRKPAGSPAGSPAVKYDLKQELEATATTTGDDSDEVWYDAIGDTKRSSSFVDSIILSIVNACAGLRRQSNQLN